MTIHRQRSRSLDEDDLHEGEGRPSGDWGDVLNLEVARHPEDMAEAFELLYEQYRRMGYVRQHASRLRVTWWDALPGAVRIVARQGGRIVGTLGLVPDSDAGLPADTVASSQLEDMRANGRVMYEVCGVAMATEPYNMWGVMRMFRYGLRLLLDHRHVTGPLEALGQPSQEGIPRRAGLLGHDPNPLARPPPPDRVLKRDHRPDGIPIEISRRGQHDVLGRFDSLCHILEHTQTPLRTSIPPMRRWPS